MTRLRHYLESTTEAERDDEKPTSAEPTPRRAWLVPTEDDRPPHHTGPTEVGPWSMTIEEEASAESHTGEWDILLGVAAEHDVVEYYVQRAGADSFERFTPSS